MPAVTSCERCGSSLRPDAPEGLCGTCLLTSALTGFDGEMTFGEGSRTAWPAADRLWSVAGYELLEEIARGGMGVVYKARQTTLGRLVALKMIRAGQFAHPSEVQRFRREAEAAARLQHPNIVAVHEVGEQDGHCFYSMDYVEGRTLGQLLREGPPSRRLAAQWVRVIAEAIHYAHSRGIVHRDLKPSNVLIDRAGQPRVTDFGLAKVFDGVALDCEVARHELTQSAVTLGSPSYMPPEQVSRKHGVVGTRSDVYSLGAILYELLTGRPPFVAETAMETLELVLHEEPIPPRRLKPAVPPDLETICLKCLEKTPEKRYATAADLAEELGRFLRDEPIHARPITEFEKFWRWCRRNPVLTGSLAASFLLLAVIAAGSSVAALRISRAEQEATEKLWLSYLEQARATRLAGRAGRRTNSLAAIAAAARINASLPLRNEAIAALALTDLGPGQVFLTTTMDRRPSLAVDSRGDRFAALHEDGRVTVQRISDGASLNEFTAPVRSSGFARFSPNGRYLAGNFARGHAAVWGLMPNAPTVLTNLPVSVAGYPTFAFTPDNDALAIVGTNGVLSLLNLPDGDERARLDVGVSSGWIEIEPTGQRVAVIYYDVFLWDIARRVKVRTLQHRGVAESMAWHPEGRRLAVGYRNGDVLLWDVQTGESRMLAGHTQFADGIVFDPRGEFFLSHSWDGATRFWSAANGAPLFMSAQAEVRQMVGDGATAILRKGRSFLAASLIRSRSHRAVVLSRMTQRYSVGADMSADGRWLAVGEHGGWHVYDLAAGKEFAMKQWRQPCWPLFVPRENAAITVSPDAILRWDLAAHAEGDERPEVLFEMRGSEFQRGTISADGLLLAVAGHNRSVILDLQNPSNSVPFAKGLRQSHVSFSPDKRWVAAASYLGTGVTVWNAQSGILVRHVVTNDNAQIAFSPDARTLATLTPAECVFWDTTTWAARRRIPVEAPGLVAGPIAFSRDGKLLAMAPDRREIKLLAPETGVEIATLTAPAPENFEHLAFSADGQWLAAPTLNWVIQLWNLDFLRRELAAMHLDW